MDDMPYDVPVPQSFKIRATWRKAGEGHFKPVEELPYLERARFSTTSGGTASIEVGTRLPRQLLVPVKDMPRTGFVRTEIREFFERRYRESERLEVRFLKNKCYVKVAKPIPEVSESGRVRFHFTEKNLEFQIVPGRRAEIMEG